MSSFTAAFPARTSRSTSALAERQPLPWLYPYREDAQSTRLDGSVFRPFVPISLVHAVGGRVVNARYKAISMRLHPPDAEEREYVEWQAQVGFIGGWHSDGLVLLGSVGFLDHFTVTASRFAQAVAVAGRGAFDDRFGVVHAG